MYIIYIAHVCFRITRGALIESEDFAQDLHVIRISVKEVS
jgi:hypothetical protein